MRRALPLAALLILSSSASALAEDTADTPAPPAWTVQVDPLTTALGFVHVQIERRLAPRFSLYAGPHARLFRGIGSEDNEDHKGIGLEAGARWFFLGRRGAPAGFWAQVRGVAARVSKDGDAELGGYVSALVGYTHIFAGRWVLAGGLGVQYLHYSVNGVGTEGVLPAAHTTIGVAF